MQIDPLSIGICRQALQEAATGLTGRRRVPVGREHQHRCPPQLSHDIGEQDGGRVVCPLQVIEHQQEPARPGRLRQPPADLGEQREPPGAAGVGTLGQRRTLGVTEVPRPYAGTGRVVIGGPDGGLIEHEPPEPIRRRTVRAGRPGPGHRHPPRRGRCGSRLRQPGLPDSCLTRAQHQAPAARHGVIQQARDPSQLAVPPHQQRGRPALHASHQATINTGGHSHVGGCAGQGDAQDRHLIEQPMLGRCGSGTGCPARVSSMAAPSSSPVTGLLLPGVDWSNAPR